MKAIDQKLEELVAGLAPLAADWKDDVASGAIARLEAIAKKECYERSDIIELLSGNFDEGVLCARLFLAMSKDTMESELKRTLGSGGIGVKRYSAEPEAFVDALDQLGLPAAMTEAINRQAVWSDVLVERLRSGRGSAIQGQRRGRDLEDFAEGVVKEVFGKTAYEIRCTFAGVDGKSAKCDFAIPDKRRPRILIEVKGYGATGSKMTDIIGDLDAIIEAKRHDTVLLFVTDGVTWKSRLSDLNKIVQRQNSGKIARIYTSSMRRLFVEDLTTLKSEIGIS